MNSIKKTWNQISRSPRTVREFGFILSGFLLLFPLLANAIGILFANKPFHYWLGWPFVSAVVLLINLLAPPVMSFIYRVITLIAHGVSWVLTRVVLATLFYLLLSPWGIAMRIFGQDLLKERIDRGAATYWNKRPPKRPRSDYERLF